MSRKFFEIVDENLLEELENNVSNALKVIKNINGAYAPELSESDLAKLLKSLNTVKESIITFQQETEV